MIYSKFSLNNFRCFKTEQHLEIAIPSNERVGSGLTYIVGANNSGKTSILEAMQFNSGDLLRNADQGDGERKTSFLYYDGDNNICRKVENEVGHYILKSPADLSSNKEMLPYFVSARRYWESRVQHIGEVDKNWLIEQSHSDRLRMSSIRGNDFDVASLLKKIENSEDSSQYEQVNQIMSELIRDFKEYKVAFDEYEYIEYRNGRNRYKSSFSGEGITSLLRIVVNIIATEDRPIVIDEPELSLHPMAKRRLAEWLGEISRTRQIIIATHDPYFVSWDYVCNGAKVNRFVKDLDSSATIHHLDSFDKYERFVQTGHNWQKPQMMDLLSKEIFFCDNILFLEGQEDVGLLKAYNCVDEHIVNIFDYGIGGIDFAEASLALANDLGANKVAIILDKGEKEAAIVDSLRRNYSDRYEIVQWNKADIRDKKESNTGRLIKEGYFDEHGKLKPEDQLDDFYEKLNIIKEYFNG